MDSTEFVLTFLGGIISGFFITVGGEVFNDYLKRLKMNVFISTEIISNISTKHREILGFGINIEQGKELEEAYARFNNTVYPWWENGKMKHRTKLFVGEEPSWIFPYLLSLDYIENVTSFSNISKIEKGDPQAMQFYYLYLS